MPARKKQSVRKATPVKAQVAKTKVVKQLAPSYVKNPRLWVGVGVVVIAALLFFFKGLFVAAVVNGQPISRLSVVAQLEKQNGKQALDNLVVEALVMQEAQKRHISVSQSDINTQLQNIQNQLKGQGMTLDEALAAQGMTQNDLVNQLKLQALLNKMIGPSVKVSDADIDAYVSKNQDSLPKDLSDSDLRAQVKQQLQQQLLQSKTQAFVANLQKQAHINYFVSY